MKKYILAIVIAAAVMLEMVVAVQYFLAQRGIKQELLEKAARDMEQSQRVASVKSEVESAVRNIKASVRNNLATPDQYYGIMTRLVMDNPHIVGAGVAFKPDYYKEQGKEYLYSPYAYEEGVVASLEKRKVIKPQMRTTLLPFDYTTREWYQKPMEDGKSLWTEPYMDQGGTHIVMCTYVEVVRDKNNYPVGVFYADVPLEDVSLLADGMYSDISDNGKVILIVQLLGFVLLGFVIWRAASASRRYKEEKVDPEKEELIKEVERLKSLNHHLTDRNQDLAKKLQAKTETTGQHWFG
jgi:ligand-binding sensor protein